MSRRRYLTQIVLLAVATALIAYGVYTGEAYTVLLKGSNICLECIGIG